MESPLSKRDKISERKISERIQQRPRHLFEDQVLRNAGSISSNIAEGYGRKKGKEYEHYLYISRGSVGGRGRT